MELESRFEFATDADPAQNYCLWDYERPATAEDKFRSINILYQSFATAGIDPRAYALVDAIRDAIGPFRTVFGVKWTGERLAWEFYFYDYKRRQRDLSISRVLAAIRPHIPCDVVARESLPYFMFSLDVDDRLVTGLPLDVVHMYVGNPGKYVSSGIAYAIRPGGTTLENFYFFFDAATQLDDVAGKVASSAVFDQTSTPLDAILLPELCVCKTICVANKQTHDCIYFSGVSVAQLIFFLRQLRYPKPIVQWVIQHQPLLDHLLFDVGFDYRSTRDGLQVLKSGYYGVF